MNVVRVLQTLSWLLLVVVVALSLFAAGSANATPLAQQTAQVVISPTQALPGQQLNLRVIEATDVAAGTILCVGLRGPGENFEQGISPAFNVRIGTVTISEAGAGEAAATVPENLVPGVYALIVGGCPPQPDIAPLTSIATAPLAVLSQVPPTPGINAALSQTWFFAEGATTDPFDTWLHLFNPNPSPATVAVTFFSPVPLQPLAVTIPPNERRSFFMNRILPPVAFGMRVDSSLPIAAERAMFFRQDGTAVVGVAGLSRIWLLSEGSTQFPFQTWILAANPNDTPANVTITFFLLGGGTKAQRFVIGPNDRFSLFVNQVLPNAAFSTRVESDQPIVVERSMFLTTSGGGHAAAAAAAPQDAWFFAEGSTQMPFDTWYLLLNPNPTPVRILMRVLTQATGPGPLLDFEIPSFARQSVFLNQVAPNVAAGAVIVSEGGQFVAERAMFFGGGAHDSPGAAGSTGLSTEWFFAEGATTPPFDTWLLLGNPSGQADALATVRFFLVDGGVVTRQVVVPGQGRISLFVNQIVPNVTFGTQVTSDLPIVAERSMYFGAGNGGTNVVGIQR